VAKVERDDGGFASRNARQLAPALGHVPVRRTVETVTPNLVPAIELIGNCVQERAFGQRVVERGIENRHLRHSWPQCRTRGLYTAQVGGVVQRCELDVVFNAAQYVRVNRYGTLELLATMNDAVTNCVN